MASPAELAKLLPDTLPEDFSEWDGEDSCAGLPADLSGYECSSGSGAVSKQSAQSPQQQIRDPRMTVAPKIYELRNQPPPLPPTAYPQQEALEGTLWAIGAAMKSELVSAWQGQPADGAASEVPLPAVQTSGAVEDGPRQASAPLPATANLQHEALEGTLWAIGAALNGDAISAPRRRPAARAANDASLTPARPSGAEADGPRNTPSPSTPAAHVHQESLEESLRAIGTALNSGPISASLGQTEARATNDDSLSPVRPSSASADGLRNAPSLSPPAVYTNDKALEEGLKAISAAWKSEPISAQQGPAAGCATNDVSCPPVRTSSAAADEPRYASSLSQPAVYPDHEALQQSLNAIGSAWKREPISATNGHAQAGATNDVSSSPARTDGAATDGPRNAPSPGPPVDEEDFFNQLRTIGSVLNAQPTRGSHRAAHARAANVGSVLNIQPVRAPQKPALANANTEEIPFKPVTSIGAARRRPIAKPFQLTTTIGLAETVCVPLFRSDLADSGDADPGRKKLIKIAAIGVVSILLGIFLGVRLLSPGRSTLAQQSVEPQPAATDADVTTDMRKPSPSTQLNPAARTTTTIMFPFTSGQPGSKPANSLSPQVDSQLMNDQLTAAPRIPQDVKVMKAKEEAPPSESISAAGTEEAAAPGAIGGVFGEQSHPKVNYVPYPLETIPAAVAEGLLMQRTPPVYPPDAWYGGITGKVVVEATVSRTGWVENVRFISGPHVFEKAALDAVRTWRYKPYTIDNVAREFQTTVEVAFEQKSGAGPLSLLHFGSHSKQVAAVTAPKSEGAGAP